MINTYLILQLEHQYEDLKELVTLADMELRSDPQKWSIRENICHLGAYQEHFQKRLQKIVSGTEPAFDRYRAEDDPGFSVWLKKDPAEIINLYFSVRIKLNEYISSIPEDGISQKGQHPLYGNMNVESWVRFFLYHENHHLFKIFQCKMNSGNQ